MANKYSPVDHPAVWESTVFLVLQLSIMKYVVCDHEVHLNRLSKALKPDGKCIIEKLLQFKPSVYEIL